MFNILVTADETAWETDQVMRMDVTRFREQSESESSIILPDKPETLKSLERVDSLLMYESTCPSAQLVRFGHLYDISREGAYLRFRFNERARLPRSAIEQFAPRLNMHDFEFNRTHWAIKNGDIPAGLLNKMVVSSTHSWSNKFAYDAFLSHSSRDKEVVREIGTQLESDGIRVWLDEWVIQPGDAIMSVIEQGLERSRCLILFMSKQASDSDWVSLEHQSVRFRDPMNRQRRLIPVRLDDADIPSILSHLAYVDLRDRSEKEYQKLLAVCRGMDLRTCWINKTYKSTIQRIRDGYWEEHDDASRDVRWRLKETCRNPAFIELECAERKQRWRVFDHLLELKQYVSSQWEIGAYGNWKASMA